eukprot:CAMPEP_0204908710 /NCGR_PEP_ID=MMETSP1397-20131031/7611_1 /ASSEMBLY_ACC=CAM_ASM_000891 /TAXON_ID=49980 /ORGANISM="Climacostomum Climacostomum virens, Strain Stock W-24" /LENGTH=316 /DNA_ID=CAMNT_0052078331 /DNA_START=227 /DNA_END=1173 /DNA_ORIENTATION=-
MQSELSLPELYKCRTLASLRSETESKFILATQSLTQDNILAVARFDEETSGVELVEKWNLGAFETWVIAASPKDDYTFAMADKGTVQLTKCEGEVAANVNSWDFGSSINSIHWLNKLMVSTSKLISVLDPETGQQQETIDLGSISKIACDPHHDFLTAFGVDNSLSVWDSREQTVSFEIRNAHKDTLLDLDFNPNNPYHIVSSSKDSTVRFWDIRKPSTCLKLLAEHSHWVWVVKFNPFHDQLLLTCSSDNTAILHRIVTASSTPMNESFFEKESDAILKRHTDFDDSVYGCAWSASEAWVYACVSYSGKLQVSQV